MKLDSDTYHQRIRRQSAKHAAALAGAGVRTTPTTGTFGSPVGRGESTIRALDCGDFRCREDPQGVRSGELK